MRYLVLMIAILSSAPGLAQTWEDQRVFGAETPTATLRLLSSTDTEIFAPVIESFIELNPNMAIEYSVTSTAELDAIFRDAPDRFDLVISSAMDLQLKLANDGFALRLPEMDHADWAQWRRSLFAFTSEPATIVINRAAFDGKDIPNTRLDLIEALRANPESFVGRIGTYDVRASGLGYLFATQDARASESFWRLMEVMGGLDARLYCCSGEMIDDLIDGTIVVAYNVLGSYAAAREDTREALEIVLPSDFPTTMMRTALVARATRHPEEAASFIRHLIASQSGGEMDKEFPLPPLDLEGNGRPGTAIPLEPALITYLDALKRRAFLREWENAIIQ